MKNLKLNALEKREMDDKQMRAVKGGKPGECCGCACAYANTGGSSIEANGNANLVGGLNSTASIRMYNCDGTWHYC
jgi:natural product precursor